MTVFKARYLSDREVWARAGQIMEERNKIIEELADPGTLGEPARLAGLGRRLQELDGFCLLAGELKSTLADRKELEDMIGGRPPEEVEEEVQLLYGECLKDCDLKAGLLYQWLADRGYLEGEFEDVIDLKILDFIDYAGPEYAWRLSLNVGISYEESRRRLAGLLEKGLLERVEGNMLENYHREKSWTKHMNHTYYRISREGRLCLRRLRREDE